MRYKLKKRQVKQLKKFAQIMKWPNLRDTMESLRQKDEDFSLDSISSDAFAYFSGLVLPGVSEPLTSRQEDDEDEDGTVEIRGSNCFC